MSNPLGGAPPSSPMTPASGTGQQTSAPNNTPLTSQLQTVVASPALLSRIEALISKIEATAKTDLGYVETTLGTVPKVEAFATKYWMAIGGLVAGVLLDHLLKLF